MISEQKLKVQTYELLQFSFCHNCIVDPYRFALCNVQTAIPFQKMSTVQCPSVWLPHASPKIPTVQWPGGWLQDGQWLQWEGRRRPAQSITTSSLPELFFPQLLTTSNELWSPITRQQKQCRVSRAGPGTSALLILTALKHYFRLHFAQSY